MAFESDRAHHDHWVSMHNAASGALRFSAPWRGNRFEIFNDWDIFECSRRYETISRARNTMALIVLRDFQPRNAFSPSKLIEYFMELRLSYVLTNLFMTFPNHRRCPKAAPDSPSSPPLVNYSWDTCPRRAQPLVASSWRQPHPNSFS